MNILKHLNKKEIVALCEKIDMPTEATQKIIEAFTLYDYQALQSDFEKILCIETGYQGFKNISEAIKEKDTDGFIWLAISLSAALCSYEKYSAMGISDDIFYDTMGCFSRFVKEHYDSFGKYGFDRAFWSYRQLSQVLYRIGTLEFEIYKLETDDLYLDDEKVVEKGENVLSIHIPSDAKVNAENCRQSYKMAIEFFNKFYPEYKYKAFYCESWLMSPNLKKVLKENSNILQFQSDFHICRELKEDTSFDLWVFKKRGLEVEEWPENTSLQRNIKAHIKNGGIIGAGEGIILAENMK